MKKEELRKVELERAWLRHRLFVAESQRDVLVKALRIVKSLPVNGGPEYAIPQQAQKDEQEQGVAQGAESSSCRPVAPQAEHEGN